MRGFRLRGAGLAYLIQGLVWRLQKKRNRARRQKEKETWRLVRAVAAHSRQQQRSKPRARQLDLPDKPPDTTHNGNYVASCHATPTPDTKVIFQTGHHWPTIIARLQQRGRSG